MKISKGFTLYMVMVCLILLGAASAWSQTNFSVKIYAEDGSGWKDSVYIGKNTAATDPVGWPVSGDSLNPTLVETELPPLPPPGPNQAPDARLLDPTGLSGVPTYGQGVRVDIRNLVNDGQKHIYRMSFRRGDPDGSAITLSWPSGLGAIGGGGFYMTDGFGGFLFPPVDMSSSTSFTHATFNGLSGSFVDIVVGDGSMMRTFTNEEIATAADLKGKVGKYQKRKAISVDFEINLTAPVGGADLFYIEFDKIVEGTVSFPGDTNGHLTINISALKKYTLTIPAPPLDPGQLVVVNGNGNKGKVMKGKYYFTIGGAKGAKVAFTTKNEYLRQPMPNINNIGDELYLQSANLGVGLADQIGLNAKGKPIIHHISLPKWKDVTKTLYKFKNVTILQDGPAYCLDTIKSKANIKMLKSLGPDKTIRVKDSGIMGNKLIGECIALKFNIAASAKDKTPSQGFGELILSIPGHAYNGKTVNQISVEADSALACTGALLGGYNVVTLALLLDSINTEFSGPFDTLGFGAPAFGKPLGGTVATGIKPVALSNIFVGSGAVFAPAAPADFSSLYDVPKAFTLSQNYPNPFNPTTTIEFTIPDDAFVTLKVYNMLGQEVATLAEREEFSAGENSVELDGAKLATGVYYYRIVVNDGQFQEVRKMVLMK